MALLNGARLSVLRKNSDDVVREVLIRTSEIRFGSKVNCTIRLKSELAEKLHCKVFVKNEKVFIANYSSKNPISVDGKVILNRAILSDGCLIEICRTRFRWIFNANLLQARVEKVKKAERTPTSSKFGKPRRTTIVRKKQIIEQAEPAVGSSGRQSGPRKSQKTSTYTLPKNNKQLMKNIKKRFTMYSVMVDHNSDDDEEIDGDEHDQNESAAPESNIDHDVTDTPKKLVTPDVSKNNTPFYTPDPEKENQTPVAVGKTPRTPKPLALQLENSAMMILSYTPVVGPRSKANVAKTPLSSAKKATHGLRSGFLTPKNDNISTVAIALNSPNVSKVGNSMYLIDLTTPSSKNSSYVSNRSDQSFSSSAGLIDLTTPPSKKTKTPSSAIAKSSQKGLLRSALKNASKTPLSALRSRLATGTSKNVAKALLEDLVSKSPKTPAKSIGTARTPASGSKSKARSQMGTPVMDNTSDSPAAACSREPQTPQEKSNLGGETATPKETPVMTTDELFDTLVGRQSIRKTYSRKSESPKKLPSPLVPAEGTSELPKTDIDIWVESVVAAVTSPEPVDAESFMKMPNRTTQVRSSQYSDITPHESFSDALVAVATEIPPTDESQEKTGLDEVSAVVSDGELDTHDKPNPAWARRSHTPLASKIVRSLGNKRQTIGNFFTNMFGKLTVSPVTRVSITDGNSDEVAEEILDRSSEHESEASEEEYHDSESDQQVDAAGQSEDINPSPKLRQSLRDTRKFIGNALTSLNTSKLTLDNSGEIDESLLLNETYDDNARNQSELVEENYDLTDLSARPDVSSAATVDDYSKPSISARKSARKVVHQDFRSEISPMDNEAQTLSPRVVRQTRTSVSVSTPSVRKNIRQTLDVDISPLAVPLQVTPVKESRKSAAHSAMSEQEIATSASDEPHQSPVTDASEIIAVDTSPENSSPAITEKRQSPVSRRSSRTSIAQISISDTAGSADELMDQSSVSGTEPSDVGTVECPVETTESATPLRTRLSRRVSRNPKVNVEAQQSEPAEESIQDELQPSADVSSVDHIINTSATEIIAPILEKGTELEEVETENDASIANNSEVDANEPEHSINLDNALEITSTEVSRTFKRLSTVPAENMEQTTSECVAIKNTPRSRRVTVSSLTPLQEGVKVELANPDPTLGLLVSDKRITRKSLAVTAASSPNARQTTSTMLMSESKLSIRGNRSTQRLPAKLLFNDSSMDDDHSSTPVKAVTENSAIDEDNAVQQIIAETISPSSPSSNSPDKVSSTAGDNQGLMQANHDSLSASALETVDTEEPNVNKDDHQERSTVSEMVSSIPVRQGRSSLRQSRPSSGVSGNDRLIASTGKPVSKPATGTPLFRKVIGTPSRSSGIPNSAGLRTMAAAAGQVTQEMTPVRAESKPGTPVRSSRKSTIGGKDSTSVHCNPEIDTQNESTILDAASIGLPNKDSEQTSVLTEGLRESLSASSPIIHTPRTRRRASKMETPIAGPVLAEFEPETGVKTLTSVRRSIMLTSVETSSADKSVSIQTIEETHDSIVEQDETKSEVFTSSEEVGESVTASSKIESAPDQSIEIRSPRRESRPRKSTVGARQSIVNAETDPQNESTEPDVSASEQTSMSTEVMDEPATVPSTVERKPQSPERSVSDEAPGSARKSLLAKTTEEMLHEPILDSSVDQQDASITEPKAVTPLKETSVMAGNAAEVVSTPEHSSPARASRSSRRSTIVSNDTASIGSNSLLISRSASKRSTMEAQLSESIVEQPNASTTEPEASTPSKETSVMTGNAAEASMLASTPEHISPVRASRPSRRSTIVSEDTASVGSKSLPISRSASKRSTMEAQLSESIVEQPDASTTEFEVTTPSKETSDMTGKAAEASMLASSPEHISPARASRSSRRSTIGTNAPDASKDFAVSDVAVSIGSTPKQTEMSTGNLQTSMTASPSVTCTPRSRASAKKIAITAVSTPLSAQHEATVKTPASVRKSLLTSRSASKRATLVKRIPESIVEQPDVSIIEHEVLPPSKESFAISEHMAQLEQSIEEGTPIRVSLSRTSKIGAKESTPALKNIVDVEHGSQNEAVVFNVTSAIQSSEQISMLADQNSEAASLLVTSQRRTSKFGSPLATPLLTDVEHDPSIKTPTAVRKSLLTTPSGSRSLTDSSRTALLQEQISDSIVEQQDASIAEPKVATPSKETSVTSGNAASDVVSTPEHSSPARASRSTRKSTIVLDDTSSVGSKSLLMSRSASKRATMEAQLSESIVEQPDASTTELEVSTPSKETSDLTGNAAEISKVAYTPVHSPARASRSSRRSTIVSEDASSAGSKSLLISRSASKRATIEAQLSESIAEQPDASTTELEVSTPSKETSDMTGNAAEACKVASTPEHISPARASRSSRRSTVVSDDTASIGSKSLLNSRSASKRATMEAPLSESIVEQPDASTTEPEASTPSKETSAMTGNAAKASMLASTPEHISPARASRSSRRSTIVSDDTDSIGSKSMLISHSATKRATMEEKLSESIVETELEVSTPSKETSDMTGNAAEASKLASTPENISPERASRSSRRSTIVSDDNSSVGSKSLLASRSASKRTTMEAQLSESIVEQPDASTTEFEVSTPSKETSDMTGNADEASKVASTPEHISPARASRSSRRSTIVADDTASTGSKSLLINRSASKRATMEGQLSESIVEQPDASTTELEVSTPSKETSDMTGNAAEASKVASTPENISPERASRSSRRSTIVSDDNSSVGSKSLLASRSASKRTTMEAQLSESIVEQPDASTTEFEVSTPSKETSDMTGNADEASKVASTPEHISPARASRSSRRSTIVADDTASTGSKSLLINRSASKRATMEGQLSESIVEQPDASTTELEVSTSSKETSDLTGNAAEASMSASTPEHISPARASRSFRRSTLVSDDTASIGSKSLLNSRSASKRATMEAPLSESIIEHPDASTTELEVSALSKETSDMTGNAAEAFKVASTPEHISPARASRSSRRSTIVSDETLSVATKRATMEAQLSESIAEQPDPSTTELEVSTPSKETADMTENVDEVSKVVSTPEHISPARASRSSRRSTFVSDDTASIGSKSLLNSRSASKRATMEAQLSESIVEQPDASTTEPEASTPSKETTVMAGNAAEASKVASTPEHIRSARASRSSRRATIVSDETSSVDSKALLISHSATKRATIEAQLSESIVEQPDASTIELEVCTPSKETSDMTGKAAEASKVVSTPENISPARASRSSRRSTIVAEDTSSVGSKSLLISRSASKRATMEAQLSESIVEQPDASTTELEVSTPSKETSDFTGNAFEVPKVASIPEHISPVRASRSSRRSTIGTNAPDASNDFAVSDVDVSIGSSPKQTEMSTENLQTSMTASPRVIRTPRIHASAKKIATSAISTPVSADFEHGTQVKTPASVRKSLLASRSASKKAIVEQPDASMIEPEVLTSSKESFIVSEIVAELEQSIENGSPVRTSLSRKSTIGAKDSTPGAESRQNVVEVEQGTQHQTVDVNVTQPIHSSEQTSVLPDNSQKSAAASSVVTHTLRRTSKFGSPFTTPLLDDVEHGTTGCTITTHTSLTQGRASEFGSPFATPLLADDEHETSIKTPASVRKSLLTTPSGPRSLTESSRTVLLQEQIHDSIVEQQDASIAEPKVVTPSDETSVSSGNTAGASEVVSTPEHSSATRASRSTRRSTIGAKENVQALSPQSPTLQVDHTPRTRGRLSKIGTPASVVKEGLKTPASVKESLLTSPTATVPIDAKLLQETIHESTDAQHDGTIPGLELLTPTKESSTVESRIVESTPELTHPSRACVATPAVDTIFKTPRPIRGTRTPLKTPTSTTKEKQLLKSVASGTPVQETRSSRKSSHALEAGDRNVYSSPQLQAVHDDDLFNQTAEPSTGHKTSDRRSTRFSTSIKANSLTNVNAESSLSSSMMIGLADSLMTVTDANVSETPFIIEETPIKSVAPSVSKNDVSGNTSSVDVCPDLLKHISERVISLEHELDTLADDSAENTTSSANVQQSLDETDTLMGIQKLLETPAATSTTRKKLRSTTVPMELSESSNLEGVEQLLKTPISQKLLRTPETVSEGTPTAATAHSELDKTTQDSIGNLDGIQKLMETPVALAVRRKKLQKHPAIDLSSSYHAASNTTVDFEGVEQLLKTPAVSSTMKMKVTRTTPDTSMQLEGVHELLRTPVAVPDASNERQDNIPVAMEGSQRRNLRTSAYSANSSSHLEGVQRLLETPVASAISPNDTLRLEGIQQLLRTPFAASTARKILQSPTSPDSADLKKADEFPKTPFGNGSNLEGVEQIFKTPIAPPTARKSLRSAIKVPRTKQEESSNFEGIQQMLQTPSASVPIGRLLRSPAIDSSINLEGLEQLLKSPAASTPAVEKTTKTPVPSIDVRKSLRSSTAVKLNYTDLDASSNIFEGFGESPVATTIFPEEQLDATKETTLNKTVDLEGIQQLLQTPNEASIAKSDKSICLESVQQLFKTPNSTSVVKRKGRSAATAVVNRCNLDDSDALEGIQNLLKTPKVSSAIRKPTVKLNDTSLNDTINMEGLQQLLETPMDAKKKLGSTSTVHEDTVILDGIQQLLKTPTSKRGNESQQHDSTANLEGLQSLLSTPMALSSAGKSDPKSIPAVDGLDQNSLQSTPAAVVTNESVNLEGIQQMLETPVVASTGNNLLKRALVNRIRGTPANTSTNVEGIQQPLATPTVISSSTNQKPSEDSPNDSHLEGIQQMLLTPATASVKVDISVSDSVEEVSTPTNTRHRRKLYTKNDPEDRTPEAVKSPEVHPVSSNDYLNILAPIAAKDTRLGKKLAQPTESDNASKNVESSVDEPIRKNPSRATKKNKSLAEEALAGASPELKYVKQKQPKIVEERSPSTSIEVLQASTSAKSDSGDQDLSAGRRKVMFNENLQIKEINSPALVGDIIQKVFRGRGRNAQKEVRVIVAEPSEQITIKPARRATKQDADQQPSVELVDADATNKTAAAKRPRRGVKRVIDAVEVSDDGSNSQPEGTVDLTGDTTNDGTVPEVSDKSEAEPVVKRARRATTKSKPETTKTSTRTRTKKLDTVAIPVVELLHDEAAVSADQAESAANPEHSKATSASTPERSQSVPQETPIDLTSPAEPAQDVQKAPEPVSKASEDEQVVEPLSGQGKRGAKKPTSRPNRAKSSKKNASTEDSATDAHTVVESGVHITAQESTVTTNTVESEASGSAAKSEQSQRDPQETPIDLTSPAEPAQDVQKAPEPVTKASEDEQVVEPLSGRGKRGAKKPTTRPNRAKSSKKNVSTEDSATDAHTVVESGVHITAQESTVTTNTFEAESSGSAAKPERSQRDPQEVAIDITSPVEPAHAPEPMSKGSEDEKVVEPLSGRGKRGAKKPTTRTNRAKSSKNNVLTEDSATDAHTVAESVEHITAQESTVTTNTVESEASGSAAEPLEEKAAPKRPKRATAGKNRQRGAGATKTETSDAGSQIQEEQVLDTSTLRNPIAEAPVVEQAAADSTSHDEPEPMPSKRGRARNTRKPASKTTDESIVVREEAPPMPPPPAVDIIRQLDEISDKPTSKSAPARKGRKKPVAEVKQLPEVHITEESLNESHMVRTMLPSTHTSTPLMPIEEKKLKPTRSRARKAVNPTVAALIAEESTPTRRSPRSRRQADSESRTQDSQNVTDTEEPKTKRPRARTVAKMNVNDDSKDHPPTEENVSTAIEEKPTEVATSKDKKPSKAPAKRGRGKTDQTETEAAVVEEVAPKRIRKLPAKLLDADSDLVPTTSSDGTKTDADKADPEVLPSRSRRGGTKQTERKADNSSTKVSESIDNTNDESNDVQKKPSKSRKPAAKRPATRKKTAHVEEEQEAASHDASIAKEVQKVEEPAVVESVENATATTSRRRPLRSRK